MDQIKVSSDCNIFIVIMIIIAVYYSFKKNNGFNFISFLAATNYPLYYLIYILATGIKK